MRHFINWLGALAMVFLLFSCSVSRHTVGRAAKTLLQDSALQQAHIGISIYDVGKGRYLYNYQGDKYFIPASNTKLFTCYAGMKYLGDSLTGMRFAQDDTAIWLMPMADPTLLHPDFKQHPVLDFLQKQHKPLYLLSGAWRENALGYGWAWDDYSDDYMVERSPFPVHGNMALYRLGGVEILDNGTAKLQWNVSPPYFKNVVDSMVAQPSDLDAAAWKKRVQQFSLQRQRMGNRLNLRWGGVVFAKAEIPVYTDTVNTAIATLQQGFLPTIKKGQWGVEQALRLTPGLVQTFQPVKSQPTDSMLKPMMHRSDNFYAEQSLLMISQQLLGRMRTGDIIDTLLKTDLKDLPQRPQWVDGSGLSRYNLATPQSFVQLLQKMKAEFGMDRLKNILATGGEGTIRNYYQPLKGLIFAKTGTLSNNCALSGYLLTKNGNWLIFSVLANNYPGGATPVRRAVEWFLTAVQRQN